MRSVLVFGILALSLMAGAMLAGVNPGFTTATQTATVENQTQTLDTETQAATSTASDTATTEDVKTSASNDTATTLNNTEIQDLLYMREEEKLARDVYLTLYQIWGLQVFANIAESEQRHTDAVLSLIEKYNLTDPAVDEVGVFTNPELQDLYNKLVEMGSQSLENAILVGGLIEEKDIIDINKAINETNNPDIIQVYQNLVGGSANHLKAFSSTYEQVTGEPYTPQLLSPELYQQIISSNGSGHANHWK